MSTVSAPATTRESPSDTDARSRCSKVLLPLLILSLAAAACQHGAASPTQPTAPVMVAPVDLTGTWSGPASDSSGSGQMTWQLSQTGTAFSGTLTMIDASTALTGKGSVSGTVSGSSMQFSIAVPVGGFDGSFASCAASVSGEADVSLPSVTGTYSGSNSCSGTIASGQLRLSRQ